MLETVRMVFSLVDKRTSGNQDRRPQHTPGLSAQRHMEGVHGGGAIEWAECPARAN